MTFDERFDIFASGYEQDLPSDLEDLYAESAEAGLPVIRRELFPLLRFVLKVFQPKRILEVGTGYGFSSLFIRNTLGGHGIRIDTIEMRDENAERAAENIMRFDACCEINLIRGDAGKEIVLLQPGYDFVFLDGPKAQYTEYFAHVSGLLNTGGILFADNIMAGGEILESRYALERRQRTTHERMHEFLNACFKDNRFETVLLPVADGVCISVKRDDRDKKGNNR